jgi:hypothetical protein
LDAAPTPFAILEGCLLGSEILATPLLTFFRGTWEDLSIETAPTSPYTIFTILSRIWGGVTLQTLRQCFRFQHLQNLSVDADPAVSRYATVFARVVWRAVTLTTSALAILLRSLNESSSLTSLEAAPTQQRAMGGGFLCSRIAWKILSLGIRLSGQHRLAVDADPARVAIFLMRERLLF